MRPRTVSTDPTRFSKAQAVEHLRAADPALGRWIDLIGPCGLDVRTRTQPFHSLGRAIVYQQLAGSAAAAIHGRVLGIYGGRSPRPQEVLDTPFERLRAAGLSQAKALAIVDLARKAVDGTVPVRSRLAPLDDDAIVERLTTVRGVGRWTVEMLLIFDLGRPDVLPLDDYGVRKGFARLRGWKKALPSRQLLARRGDRWRPHRSVASWYLWRMSEWKGESP